MDRAGEWPFYRGHVFAQTTSSPSFALRDEEEEEEEEEKEEEEEEEKEEEEETRYRTVVSGQRGCSITGNSPDHQQSQRYLRPQAVA